jgi:hypothetical protein
MKIIASNKCGNDLIFIKFVSVEKNMKFNLLRAKWERKFKHRYSTCLVNFQKRIWTCCKVFDISQKKQLRNIKIHLHFLASNRQHNSIFFGFFWNHNNIILNKKELNVSKMCFSLKKKKLLFASSPLRLWQKNIWSNWLMNEVLE